MTYQWKEGARIRASADIAAQVMRNLEENGGLSAKTLVDASRPEDAPLHSEFEWIDSKAAERWREHQARHLINAIVVVEDQKAPLRQFFKVSVSEPNYHSIHVILSEADSRKALLEQAKRELAAFEAKYRQLSELTSVFEAADRITW